VRSPDERQKAAHAHAQAHLGERVELAADEIEARREVPEEEVDDGGAVGVLGGHGPEAREGEQEDREQRQEPAIGDRRRVREVVAVEERDERAPGRAAGDPQPGAPPATDGPSGQRGRPTGRRLYTGHCLACWPALGERRLSSIAANACVIASRTRTIRARLDHRVSIFRAAAAARREEQY
jgi:hypothetical protein